MQSYYSGNSLILIHEKLSMNCLFSTEVQRFP